MKEMLKWVDAQSNLMAQAQVSFADAVDRKAAAFFRLLLIGAAGALAYGYTLAKGDGLSGFVLGALATSAWLFTVAGVLQAKVLMTTDFYAPGVDAQPSADKLFSVVADDDQWMRWLLDNRQIAIDHNRRRNQQTGRWLNRCHWLAIATPLPCLLAMAWAAY